MIGVGYEVSTFSRPKGAQQKIDKEIRALEESIREMRLCYNKLLSLISQSSPGIPASIWKYIKATEASVAFSVISHRWKRIRPSRAEDVKQRLDEEIREFEKSVLDLKMRRNSLTLIARLPPEILVAIFKCLESVLRPSHVCSHWRHVALGCPSLWANLNFYTAPIRHEWVQEMLERSKSLPLTFGAKITPRSKDTVLSVLTSMDRIQILSLRSDTQLSQELLNVLVTRPAPLLEYFELSGPAYGNVQNLPHNLFARHLPRLRELKLVNYTVPRSLLNRLTSLTISLKSLTTMNKLMSTLKYIPSLINLELELLNAILSPPANGQVIPPFQTIALPHLSNIVIKSDLPGCVHILSRLSFPTTSSITIYSLKTISFTHFLATFCTMFSTDSRFGAGPPIRYLKMEFGISFLYKAWNILGSNWEEPAVNAQFTIIFNDPPLHAIRPLSGKEAEFWDALPIDAVESLHLSLLNIPKKTWLSFCRRLDQLVTLGVSNSRSMDVLLEVLSLRQTEKSDEHIQRTSPLYFPALRELSISNWHLSDFGLDDGILKIQQLKECLKGRYGVSAGIPKLRLQVSHRIFQIDAAELKDVIPEFFWDTVINDFKNNYHSDRAFFGDNFSWISQDSRDDF